MKTSVVLSSYNGEEYIEEQLQSILEQTLRPDEVLIVDDGSTDSTVTIVKSFILKNQLEDSWLLRVNQENKGWRRNFMDSFHKASGDVIFSCDQDDIWDKERVEKMVLCFEENPDMEVLASNFAPFMIKEGKTIPLKNGLTKKKLGVSLKKRIERVEANKLVLHTFVPGCALAFRSSLLEIIDIIWFTAWAHDSVISIISKLRGTYYFMNETLLYYRRHEGTSTPANVKTCEGRIDFSETYLNRIDIIRNKTSELGINDSNVALLQTIDSFHKTRIGFFSKNIGLVELLKYINFYSSLYSFLGDLYIRMKN